MWGWTAGATRKSNRGSQLLPRNESSNLWLQNSLLMLMIVYLALFSGSKIVLFMCYTDKVGCRVEAHQFRPSAKVLSMTRN